MIILAHAWLTLLSLPQAFQGTREEGGFGVLLTETEQHTVALPHQEEPERCALECMLQVLMSIFQSYPATDRLPVVSIPGTGESNLASTRLAGGLPLGLPPDDGTAAALWDTQEVNLLPGMLANGAQDIAPLAFPALEGQNTGPSPVAASVPLPAMTPSVSRESVLATAEVLFVSPVVQQTFLASGGESPTTAGLQQPALPQSPASTPTPTLMGSAVVANTQLLSVGEQVFQHTSQTSQPSPGGAVPAIPWAGHAAVPSVAQDSMPLPSSPQAAATTGNAPVIMALAQENIALPQYDASAGPRYRPDSREWGAETPPSVASPLTTDSALPLSSARTTSHLPSAAPAIAVPTNHSLEDLGRPWRLPMSANTVVLHLEPRELGALLLRVRVNDKRLIASFQTQSPEAEILLRSHLPSLHESLSQHGFEVQPIAITRAAEGLSTHMEAGMGAFAHQHSAFQGFAEDWQAANASETQDEVDLQRAPRWPAEQRPRLLDVVI